MSAALVKPFAIAKHEGVEQVEAAMLNLPQVDCPVAHHFGPGIYIREVTMPSGIFAIGHLQKYPQLNVMLAGKVLMEKDGEMQVMSAPLIFVGEPGRKVGYVLETCVWQNIYATEETDIDKLEDMFLDKSETWNQFEKENKKFRVELHESDRNDFNCMLDDLGVDAATVRQQSENTDDQIRMPDEWSAATSIRDSDIEGKGLFLSWPVPHGTIIAPARIDGQRTPAGRYVNHSQNPNCFYTQTECGTIYLVSKQDIHGCQGGDQGEELTVDYRQAFALAKGGKKLCQE